MTLYPAMVNIENRLVTVIGGGDVGLRKAMDLLDAGAKVKVVSPVMSPELKSLQGVVGEMLELVERPYKKGDLGGSVLVFACADDRQVNKEVFEEASKLRIFINAVDDPDNCSFFVPSFERIGDLILAVSTSGASPSFAARMRRELSDYIPEGAEEFLAGLRIVREMLKTDPDFSDMDSYQRGRLVSRITGDNAVLAQLAEAVKEDTVKDFIKFMAGR